MKRRRSIVFYLWLGLSVQFLLLVLVVVFVLAGASYQTSAIRALHERVQSMQLVNLTVQNEYLDAQRALRGYQATGEGRFLQTFYGDGDGASVAAIIPAEAVPWLKDIYRRRASYRADDLLSVDAGELPPRFGEVLLSTGATSLLLAPFGAGSDLLGVIALLRVNPEKPWSPPEVAAVEALAGDIGRGLEHARLYEKEERLVAELQSLDQAKTSFLASSSHDLRTPLTSIIGYVELLVDGDAGPIPPLQAKMIDAISRNTRRLRALIEDMLTISKMELGSFTSNLRPLDLVELVPQVAEAIRPSAAESGLTLEVDCRDGELMVDGDSEQLDRVLLNLLSNAVKYTPRGGKVALTAAREDDVALLTVDDTGMGIPVADQRSLFTRFFRASNAVAQHIPGSGLGLSIVHTVVANHRGEVKLTSEEGHGTSVAIRIPLLQDGPGVQGPAHAPRAGRRDYHQPAESRGQAA
jgi:signal transduction histidine kinase